MASIIAPWSGCMKVSDLNGKPFVIFVVGDGSTEFRAGAWQGERKGCDPTTHHQRELLIDGGTASLKPLADGVMKAIELDYKHWDPCGHHQVDVKNMSSSEFVGPVLDMEVDCGKPEKPVLPPSPIEAPPPAVELPPVYTEVPILPPGVPEQFDHAAIPEPASLLLMGGAMTLAALRQRVRRRK